jgi:ribosomal protein S18 acetylase RimI-like enzyme
MVTETLRWRGGWARIAPLAPAGGSSAAPSGPPPDAAHLTVGTDSAPPREAVEQCLARLRRAGYREVVTNALSPADSLAFVDSGFTVRERLHLLEHDLAAVPVPPRPSRRARHADRDQVLGIDARAFEPSWRLSGTDGLTDALRATPVVRFRVAQDSDVVGYAISGRAGAQGYLQRIAIDPDEQGIGWGRALVADALQWFRHRSARRALVNTQRENAAALSLYESCGFRRLPVGLCVLGRAL